MLLMDFFETTYTTYHPDLGDAAAVQIQVAIRVLESSLGRPPTTDDLTDEVLTRWMAWMKAQGRAPATINGKRCMFLSLWREASRRRHCCGPDPTTVPPPMKPLQRIPSAWSLDQLSALLKVTQALPGEIAATRIPRRLWWTSLISALYDTGARLSAMLSVRPADFDPQTFRLTLRAESAKTGLEQSLMLSNETAAMIARLMAFEQPTLWPRYVCKRTLYEHYDEILRRAGLPNDRRSKFHRIRRTTATQLTKHAGMHVAQRVLGHTSEAMTRRYVDTRQVESTPPVCLLPRPGGN